MATNDEQQQAMTSEQLRQAIDDSVLTHTGRSIGDVASQRVIEDIWPLIEARNDTETILTAGVTIEERTVVDRNGPQDAVCIRFYLADGSVRETWFAIEDMHQLTRYWNQRHPILARTAGRA